MARFTVMARKGESTFVVQDWVRRDDRPRAERHLAAVLAAHANDDFVFWIEEGS